MARCFESEDFEHLVKEPFFRLQADKERDLGIAIIVSQCGRSQCFVLLIIRDPGKPTLENMAHVFLNHEANKATHEVASNVFFCPNKTRTGLQCRFAHRETVLNALQIAINLHDLLGCFRR